MATRKKNKRKSFKRKIREYEIRDHIARKLVQSGLTVEKFNKIMGVKK